MPNVEVASVVRDKFAIIDDHRACASNLAAEVDVIDISGAVLASVEWARYVKAARIAPGSGRWRVLLLMPGSTGAVARAAESTVWAGDQRRMESEIVRRSATIADLARQAGISCEIRLYCTVPVSRYMRIGEIVYQSYYPHDRTGSDIPVLRLAAGGVLEARARKEFEVLWNANPGA